MTSYYINPAAADNLGDGSAASPKQSLVGITLAPGDKVFFLRGSTYSSTFAPTVPGTATAHITYGAYAYSDGSDNSGLPRPIINLTAPVSTYSSTNKNYVDYSDLDVRATITPANDTSVFYTGNNSTFRRMRIDTNVGCISSWNKSNVTIEFCELNGVSHSSANNNNVVTISADNTNVDNVRLKGNTIFHKGGGGTTSHVVRADTASATYSLTRLRIENNWLPPTPSTVFNPNTNTIGFRLLRAPGIRFINNNISGVLSGIYLAGGNNTYIYNALIEGNTIQDCYNFGVHIASYSRNFRIRRNVITRCGSNVGPNYYGRGIEISAGGGNQTNGGHLIELNNVTYSRNYGGPADNASEGVGIGLDDGTDTCRVRSNYMGFNEGNGLQQYGGGTGFTVTGGHEITGNIFESNCTAAFKSRRTGGTGLTPFIAHIGSSWHKGPASYIANNLFIGATLAGISESGDSDNNIIKANNIFLNVKYPICLPNGFSMSSNNLFWGTSVTVQKYSNVTYDANSAPIFNAMSFTGENDLSFDPKLDASHRPQKTSPCIGAGKGIGKFYDMAGRTFKATPSIGPYELYS